MAPSPPLLRMVISAALILIVALIGCSDEFHPTMGTLRVEFAAQSPDIIDGVEVFLNGVRVLKPINNGILELQLDAGDYRIQPVTADTCVVPDPPLINVTVNVGRPTSSSFDLLVASGVTVTSNLDGLPILLDGESTGKVTPATLGCVEPGSHRVELDLDCNGPVEPPGADVDVEEGSSHAVEIFVPTLEVQGNVPGLDILLDGASTGYQVPAVMACVSPGSHTVSIALNGEVFATEQILMGDQPQQLRVDVPRPTVLEVIGWVTCSNCPLADEATEALILEPEFQEHVYRLEIHRNLFGTPLDIFGNEETMTRYRHYIPNDNLGVPLMVFNGTDYIRGAEEFGLLLQDLRETSRSQMDDNETSWLIELSDLEEVQPYDPKQQGGEVYRLTARVLVIGDLSDTTPVLYAFAYKNKIDHVNFEHQEQIRFYDVVRTIVGPIPLNEAPYILTNRGDEAQIPLEFSYPTGERFGTADSEPPHFQGYGIVVMIQEPVDFEPDHQSRIYQAARVTWE